MGSRASMPQSSLSSITSDNSKPTSTSHDVISGVIVKSGVCSANPMSRKGKHVQMAQMLVFPMIPMALLVIQTSIGMSNYIDSYNALTNLSFRIRDMQALCDVIHALQLERAQSILLLDRSTNASFVDMVPQYDKTDTMLLKLDNWMEEGDTTDLGSRISFKQRLRDHRKLIEEGKVSIRRHLGFYNDANQVLITELSNLIRRTAHKDIWKSLVSLRLITRAKENFGIKLAWGVVTFLQGNLTEDDFFELAQNDAMGHEHMDLAILHSKTARTQYTARYLGKSKLLRKEILKLEETIYSRDFVKSAEMSLVWLDNYTNYLHILRDIRLSIKDEINQSIQTEVAGSYAQVAVSGAMLALVVVAAPIVAYLVNHVTMTIQTYAMGLNETTKELRREKIRSDALLYRMLPKSVAIQLKLGQGVTAENFDCVTILFTDIVGFTQLASRSTPMQVTEFLNKLFNFCDTRLKEYEVYKVETIGDAYMVASGVPHRNGLRHVTEIAAVSLDLMQRIGGFVIPHIPEEIIKLRMGIHSGPVAAGVVGQKMPRYCLFGETVAIAGKMEACGVPARIQLSSATKLLLEEQGGYVIQRRGLIDVPGRGTMETFFLVATLEDDGSITRPHNSRRKRVKTETELPIMETFEVEDETPM